MDKIIVYVDDAAFAREHMVQLIDKAEAAPAGGRQVILVACAPRMTQRISKWVSHSARENWRSRWFGKIMEELTPLLLRDGNTLKFVLAKGQLTDLTQQLKLEHGIARVVDARRPKIGVDMEPVAVGVAPVGHSGWALPGAAVGMGTLLIMTNELAE